jgi:hypothetical protein
MQRVSSTISSGLAAVDDANMRLWQWTEETTTEKKPDQRNIDIDHRTPNMPSTSLFATASSDDDDDDDGDDDDEDGTGEDGSSATDSTSIPFKSIIFDRRQRRRSKSLKFKDDEIGSAINDGYDHAVCSPKHPNRMVNQWNKNLNGKQKSKLWRPRPSLSRQSSYVEDRAEYEESSRGGVEIRINHI